MLDYNIINCTNKPTEDDDGNFQGWLLTILSGVACCIGASVVFSDIIFQKFLSARYIQITNNKFFLVASLSLGSGVMLFTSLHTLLQESEKSFKKAKVYREYSGLFLIVFYFLGVTGSAIINKIIHLFVNEDSFIHSHGHHHGHQHTQHTHQHHYNQQDHTTVKNKKINSPLIYKNEEIDDDDEILHEGSPLLNKNITYYANPKDCNDIKHLENSDGCDESNCSNKHCVCIVESDTDDTINANRNHDHDDDDDDDDDDEDDDDYDDGDKDERRHHHHHHHHHRLPPHNENSKDEKEKSQLMHIGIQTALAISIHKFPEGLVTFITSKVSPTIGFTLFFAIALHNISEGFTIALPLYMATRSRIKSFLYASLLGGLSQPLGALIGYLFLKESQLRCWDHNFVYGSLFAAVSGLMSVICVQGLLPQAIKNDTSNGHTVTIFFFIGVLIMGISSALFDHAKYVPE